MGRFVIQANPVIFDTNGFETIIDLKAADVKQLRIHEPILVDPVIEGDIGLNRLKIREIYWEEMSDQLGQNELSNARTLPQFDTTNFSHQGVSVSIASETATNPRILAGGPLENDTFGYEGGIGIYDKAIPDYILQGAYEYTTFTTDSYAGVYSDISSDGITAVFTDGETGSAEADICVFDYNGTTFVPRTAISGGGMSCKLNGVYPGTQYLLAGRKTGSLARYNRTGVNTWVQDFLFEASGSGVVISKIFMKDLGTRVYYYLGSSIYRWVYASGSWGTRLTYASAPGLVAFWVEYFSGNEYVFYSTATNVYVFYNGVIIQTLNLVGITSITYNGTYLFMSTGSMVYIGKQVSGLGPFVLSVNTTTGDEVNLITTMACNANTLVLGRPTANTHGAVTILDISPYVNHFEEINNIVLDSNDGLLRINSLAGTVFDNEVTFTTTLADLVAIGDINTGFRSVAGDITGFCNSVDKFSINSTSVNSLVPLLVPTGSVTAPSYTFTGDTNTGIYRIGADNLGITCNGVKQLDISQARTSFTTAISVPTGSSASPGYSFAGASSSGMYYFGTSLGFSTAGTAHMTVDGIHIVSIPPFRQLGNGSVSSPSFSWTGATNSGMYYTTNAINFSISGTKNFQINPGGNVNLNSIATPIPRVVPGVVNPIIEFKFTFPTGFI